MYPLQGLLKWLQISSSAPLLIWGTLRHLSPSLILIFVFPPFLPVLHCIADHPPCWANIAHLVLCLYGQGKHECSSAIFVAFLQRKLLIFPTDNWDRVKDNMEDRLLRKVALVDETILLVDTVWYTTLWLWSFLLLTFWVLFLAASSILEGKVLSKFQLQVDMEASEINKWHKTGANDSSKRENWNLMTLVGWFNCKVVEEITLQNTQQVSKEFYLKKMKTFYMTYYTPYWSSMSNDQRYNCSLENHKCWNKLTSAIK